MVAGRALKACKHSCVLPYFIHFIVRCFVFLINVNLFLVLRDLPFDSNALYVAKCKSHDNNC